MEEELKGLSAEEVIEKRSKGEGECQGESITRTPGQIVRDNLCTRFNALNFLIAVLLFAAGAYSNRGDHSQYPYWNRPGAEGEKAGG